MKPRFLLALLLLPNLLPVVRAADAATPEKVRRELDAKGVLYSYIDLEGGWGKVAADVQEILKDTKLGRTDYKALAEATGLAQIQALGLSSTPGKFGYDNRLYLHMPGGRKGILSLLPQEAAAFDGARCVPADVDFFLELRLDVPAAMDAVTDIMAVSLDSRELAVSMIDSTRKSSPAAADLMDFKGRMVAAFRLHPKQAGAEKDGETVLQQDVDLFFQADRGGKFFATELAGQEDWKRSESGNTVRYTKDVSGIENLIVIEGDRVHAGFPSRFVEECMARKEGLAQSAAFRQVLAETAAKGQALVYVTPKAISELRSMTGGFWSLLRHTILGSSRKTRMLNQVLSSLPVPTAPVAGVWVGRPDGLLFRGRAPQSFKPLLTGVGLASPELLGQFFVSMAEGYVEAGRIEREGAAIEKKLAGDLGVVRSVADRYFEAHPDAQEVLLSDLREEMRDEKIPALSEVENNLTFPRRSDQVTVELKSGHSFAHVYPLTDDQRRTMERQLKELAQASAEYLVSGGSYVSVSRLVESGFMAAPTSVVGEDYDSVTCDLDAPALSLETPGGQKVDYLREKDFVVKARRRLAERQLAIERNLARIHAAAKEYLENNPDSSSVSFIQLKEQGLVEGVEPVAGENYAGEFGGLSAGDTRLSIQAPRAGTVTWVRPLDAKLRAEIVGRLAEIERLAAQYFLKNPKADLVVSGELKPKLVTTAKQEGGDDGAGAEALPDLTGLVIRRDYASIRLVLENDQVVEVPRTKNK